MRSAEFPYKSTVRVTFSSSEEAEMVCTALKVDDELQPSRISRILSVESTQLVVAFAAADLKVLRVSMSGVLDGITLATKTLNEFYVERPQLEQGL